MAIPLYDNQFIKFLYEGRQFAVLVQQDESPVSPREWDNIDSMVCWHSRYRLGDRHDHKEPEDFWREMVRLNVPAEEIAKAACNGELYSIRIAPNPDDDNAVDVYEHYALRTILGNSEPSEVLEYEGVSRDSITDYILDDLTIEHCQHLLKNDMVWLPLYLYDHSGITMSTGSFGDPWDSGQVGWIVVTKEKFLAETGYTEADWPQRAVEMMQGSVKTYDQYLTGEVYGYTVYENTGTPEASVWEETEYSCWGFYGDDIIENGIVDDVPGLYEAVKAEAYETGNAVAHSITTTTSDFD